MSLRPRKHPAPTPPLRFPNRPIVDHQDREFQTSGPSGPRELNAGDIAAILLIVLVLACATVLAVAL